MGALRATLKLAGQMFGNSEYYELRYSLGTRQVPNWPTSGLSPNWKLPNASIRVLFSDFAVILAVNLAIRAGLPYPMPSARFSKHDREHFESAFDWLN